MSIWESVSETVSGAWDSVSSTVGDIWGGGEEASRNAKDHGAELRAQTQNQLRQDETKHLQGYEKTPLLAEYDKQQYQENLRKSAEQKNMNQLNQNLKEQGQKQRQEAWMRQNPGAKAPPLSEF